VSQTLRTSKPARITTAIQKSPPVPPLRNTALNTVSASQISANNKTIKPAIRVTAGTQAQSSRESRVTRRPSVAVDAVSSISVPRSIRQCVRRGSLLSIPLFVLAASACGGGSHQAATAKPEYLARVNQICAKYNTLARSVGQPSGTLEQQAATALRANAIMRSGLSAIRNVPPPAGDEQRIAGILDETNHALGLGDESSRLISTDATTANQRAEEAVALLRDANSKLAAYGLTTCAQ
jgi:hypothetical protein